MNPVFMALYHTYRPQTFDDIADQNHIVQTLTQQIANDKVAHAYIFAGPRGVGKTSSARILAKAVNCSERKDGDSAPCNKCEACTSITSGRAIDVIEIDAASHTGVDNVRENIIENAQFQPTSLKMKVFIIDEVHMLSTSAFNALLKTLEEPPKHAMFLLATTELHKLPDTIISRCQTFTFQKVSNDTMVASLQDIATQEKVTVDESILRRIAQKSGGCVRDAVSLLDQLLATGEKTVSEESASVVLPQARHEDIVTLITALVETDAATALTRIHEAHAHGARLREFAQDTVSLLRTMLLGTIDAQAYLDTDLAPESVEKLKKLATTLPQRDLITLIDLLLARSKEINTAPIPTLPLELAVLTWCNTSGAPTPKETKTAPDTYTQPATASKEKSAAATPVPKPKKPEAADKTETAPPAAPKADARDTDVQKDVIQHSATTKIDNMQAIWQQCIARIGEEMPSLSFILKMATCADTLHDGALQISVPYSFHKEKMAESSCNARLQDILTELTGTPVHLTITINENDAQSGSDNLQDLAAAFGGDVV